MVEKHGKSNFGFLLFLSLALRLLEFDVKYLENEIENNAASDIPNLIIAQHGGFSL